MAGVSITTVSKILNAPEKAGRFSAQCIQRVREAAEKIGYHRNYHASILRGGKCMNIGVALSVREVSNVLGGHYWGSILGGVEVGARQAGYELTLTGPDTPEDRSALRRGMKHLRQSRVDGLIVPKQYQEEELDLLAEADAPVVAVQYEKPGAVPVVRCDDAAASGLLVNHLSQLGHESIAWIGPEEWTTGTAPVRCNAFVQACEAAGIRSRVHSLKGRDTRWWYGHNLVRAAQEQLVSLLADGLDATAVVCFNDLVAIGAYHALDESGRAPGRDLSVAGYDNSVGELTRPGLTSVEMGFFEVGRRAVTLLLEMIQESRPGHEGRGHFAKVPPELMVRSSTAPPAGA
jgi:LacI family transcriptional regulator